MTADSVASTIQAAQGAQILGSQNLGAQNTITLVSRACNLMKTNLKAGIILILPPILLLTGVNLLVSMLSGGTFLTTASPWAMGMKLGLALAGLPIARSKAWCAWSARRSALLATLVSGPAVLPAARAADAEAATNAAISLSISRFRVARLAT